MSSSECMSAFRGFVYLFNCSTAVSRLFQDSTELFKLMRNSFAVVGVVKAKHH